MSKSTADMKASPTSRRTRSTSSASANEKLYPRPQQMRRVDDSTFSASAFILSNHVDVPTRYSNRRRVNPASLASRLGPELVKELESLLTPGMTEMPSFAARQAIQKTYNIDRRHIYDWYHTKGLRVSTKEKDAAKGSDLEGKVLRSRIPVGFSIICGVLRPHESTLSSKGPSGNVHRRLSYRPRRLYLLKKRVPLAVLRLLHLCRPLLLRLVTYRHTNVGYSRPLFLFSISSTNLSEPQRERSR